MTRVKICGLTRQEDMAAANRCLPDYIGFVFAPGSRRRVTPGQALLLKEGLDSRIKAVGVFTNETAHNIALLCETGVIDIVQLHGDENEEFIRALKEKIICPVIKAVRVQSREQILQAQQFSCDLLLLDTYQPGQYGGSGKTFDHSLIPALQKPFFLAGGLDAGNIKEAVVACRPFAVDVNSGAETNGLKDENKIRQIIETIRNIG
ncbi:MAG: phosphoribosylanthranilate isomerase [Bacillota bacterium]